VELPILAESFFSPPVNSVLTKLRSKRTLLCMHASTAVFLAFLIGIISGLRSLTAPAAVSWAARWKWLALQHSPLAFMGSLAATVIFTLLALVELVADKLPSTPSRTKPVGLIARILMGGLSGATLAAAGGQSLALGGCLGAAGGIIGAFGGYQIRMRLVAALKVPDIAIALAEDAVAIGASFLIVSRF
jgi:uncharacterized membrane protein